MDRLTAFRRSLFRSESGNAQMEYALFIALISLAVVAGLSIVGGEIGTFFNETGNALGNSVG